MEQLIVLDLIQILISSFASAQHPVLFGTTTTGNGGIFRNDSRRGEELLIVVKVLVYPLAE